MAASSFFPQAQTGFNPLAGSPQQHFPPAANMPVNPLFNPYGFGSMSPFLNNPHLQANLDETTYKNQLK